MTMLSLVCMLLLSCSALANNNYRTAQRDVAPVQSGYGSSSALFDVPSKTNSGYGSSSSLLDTVQQQPTNSYGSSQSVQFDSKPMTSSYGSSGVQFDKPMRKKHHSRFRDMSRGYGQQISSPVLLDQQQQTSSYGQQRLPSFDTPRISSYGSSSSSYGSQYGNGEQQFDIPQAPVQQPTQWDILCQNQAPETIIVLSDQASWVVCVDTGKGQIQSCQPGLIFVKETNKCERRSKGDHPCNSNPCKYGGQCVPTSQSEFQCQCTPGYDGPTCELDARVCQTQNPCGQEQCQSFDVGAALSYVCIIGGNQAYGPSSSQATPNPCANAPNGIPQPLSYTTHGFLLCDGDRFFVKACPGATIWDSNSLTCSWPPGVLQQQQQDQISSYGYSQQQQRLPVRDIPSVSSYGYGQQQQQRQPILRDLPVMSSYGSSIQQQQRDTPVISSGYGSSLPQVPQRDMTSSGYGQQTSFVQPSPTILREQSSSSYGGSSSLRDLPTISSGYGQQQQQQQQPIIPQPTQLRDTVVPSSINSYGSSQMSSSSFRDIQTPMQQSSFGGSRTMTGLFDNTPVQQQSSYGGSRLPVRDVPVQSSYGQKSSY